MQATVLEIQNTSLFTELTAEESASVNGGHYHDRCRPRRRHRRHCGYHRPRPVYNGCGGYYRTRYYYD